MELEVTSGGLKLGGGKMAAGVYSHHKGDGKMAIAQVMLRQSLSPFTHTFLHEYSKIYLRDELKK